MRLVVSFVLFIHRRPMLGIHRKSSPTIFWPPSGPILRMSLDHGRIKEVGMRKKKKKKSPIIYYPDS